MSIKINRIILNGNKEKRSLAIFLYVGNKNPKEVLDEAITRYVGDNEYYELVNDYLDNPWTRVIAQELYENFEVEKVFIEEREFNVYKLHKEAKVVIKYLTYEKGNDTRPNTIMDIAKNEISNGQGYNSYIDSDISDLWSRLLIIGVNDMSQEDFIDQKI